MVTGYPEQSAQTLRPARHQLSASGTPTPLDRSIVRPNPWKAQAHFLPARSDIFIAKSGVTSSATRGGGGIAAAGDPGRKLFFCPGCNQPSKLKKTDNYFECKRCGMEIGRRRNLHIFQDRGGGLELSLTGFDDFAFATRMFFDRVASSATFQTIRPRPARRPLCAFPRACASDRAHPFDGNEPCSWCLGRQPADCASDPHFPVPSLAISRLSRAREAARASCQSPDPQLERLSHRQRHQGRSLRGDRRSKSTMSEYCFDTRGIGQPLRSAAGTGE